MMIRRFNRNLIPGIRAQDYPMPGFVFRIRSSLRATDNPQFYPLRYGVKKTSPATICSNCDPTIDRISIGVSSLMELT
jgi:hypothetical protein